MRLRKLLPILLSAPALTASPAGADTIYLIDGTTIADCTIQVEGLSTVAYREGNNKEEVSSDKVLAIEFSRKPQEIDRAESFADEEQYFDALAELEAYVAKTLEDGKSERRFEWAPAYAMFRLIELNESLGDRAAVVTTADQLIEHAGESRYAPFAFLKKIQAMSDLDKPVTSVLDDLGRLIDDKGLSDRWKLERDLAQVLFDSELTGKKRRDDLETISDRAGTKFPTVRSRAEVAVAESFLDEKQLQEAEDIFQGIASDPKADKGTLAAAYTGLGDCLFQKGADLNAKGEDGSKVLRDALMNYMRVVVVYKQELRYVPKAMFFAGRVFQQFNDGESEGRAQTLYRRVIRDFRESNWADEARGFRK